tara:strand:- start:472 stop:678 length:207 start_codon:yes stop_codon:yes gene_type:complete
MTTEEHIIKLVAKYPNHTDLGRNIATYIKENFQEEVVKEVAKNKSHANQARINFSDSKPEDVARLGED